MCPFTLRELWYFDFQPDESLVPETAEDREKKAQAISSSRILGPEEFRLIQQRQAVKEVEGQKGKRGKKRKREEEEREDDGLVI